MSAIPETYPLPEMGYPRYTVTCCGECPLRQDTVRSTVQLMIVDEHGLTPRHLSIVKLIPTGMTNIQISKELFLSEQTVKFHLTEIFQRLARFGINNRVKLAIWARENGIA